LNLKAILSSQNAKSNLKLNNQELCVYTAKSKLERSRWLYAPIEPFLAMKTASK